ncbi:helix-turn-helix domain-containing protein [Mesorhizobium sp.]|uniref:winged helix-turn-helix transcriptional regulator n=1 Tax=Mesorhizobium sp. TaxID=1871066 RepID=UPI00257B32D8|nr:helix-turn-helix domain-containing protein [Mesorhizobium sp.]
MNKPTENGLATAIKMVSGKWKLDIICELGATSRRFGRLRQSIPAISEKMLTQQLRELEADGLVNRKVHPGSPAKVVYSLTESGSTLCTGQRAYAAGVNSSIARVSRSDSAILKGRVDEATAVRTFASLTIYTRRVFPTAVGKDIVDELSNQRLVGRPPV